MPKIAFIGAGSVVFTRSLCNDLLCVPELHDSTIALMDIDPERLDLARRVVEALIARRNPDAGRGGPRARVEATTDRRAALRGADYVITTFQQGGVEAYRLDIEIPQRYRVGQCVGDTLGPGGVFRALRTIPVLVDICRDMDDVAPAALLLNYVNPMAANCWAVDRITGRPHVGLCHSVQGTSEMLANWIDVPYDEVSFVCAGINHQAFYLTFRRGKENLYPRIWRAIEEPENIGREPVRIELMRHFGYFVTESSGHASEYVPYFRKSAEMIDAELAPRFTNKNHSGWFDFGRSGGYLRNCLWWAANYEQAFQKLISGEAPLPDRTHEYGSRIVEAIETGRPIVINGNVPNRDLIPNLPPGCCVELPCLVDANGIQPTRVGDYPPQLAALNRTNINVQELIVEAAATGKAEAVYHAVMLDPLTAAVCTLPEIHTMVGEMLEAQAPWLPELR
jgi:alpha-galactosidase